MVKAVVVEGAGATPEVAEISLPEVGAEEVRLKIAAAGVCHSDLSMINGTITPPYPVVLGHEASGIIAETGANVRDLAVGDQVVINWAPACRHCWHCLHGEPWLCSAAEGLLSTAGRMLEDGTPVGAALGVGAFAEETVLPRHSVVPLPEGIGLDVAAVMGCAVLTGAGAVRNTADVRSGESVLVMGLGGIGLSAVAGARLAGAGPIIAVDVSHEKEDLARQLGATDFLLSADKLAKQVRALTGGRGVDHAFECVGAPATVRTAWQSTRRGGRCTVVGVGSKDQEVSFNLMELFHFNRLLSSSVYGSCDPDRDIPELAAHVNAGRLALDALITHRIDLSGVAEAFERMKAGEGVRSVVELSG